MFGCQITGDTFIREIPEVLKRRLYAMLDVQNFWERLAVQIPRRVDTIYQCDPADLEFEPRFTSVAIEAFQRAGYKPGGSSTKSLLKEWGTKNSQVKHLILALKRGKLLEPAKTLEQHLSLASKEELQQNPEKTCQQRALESNLQVTCSAQPEIIKTEEAIPCGSGISRISHISEGDRSVNNGEPPPVDDLGSDDSYVPEFDSSQQKIEFGVLKKITDNFNHCRIIGEGGFGDVYLGTFQNNYKVAIKRLRQTTDEVTEEQKLDHFNQFETEVQTLSKYKHENVVLLLGYSIQNDTHCLVYQYMENGSLEERLAQRFDSPPLSIATRIEIVKGTARGITFLNNNGLVHRDVKSANILLDEKFAPKIGDFATAKVVPKSTVNKTIEMQVSKVIGTAAYLAPEAITFAVNPKLDSFSFGVILLEVLTGLPVIDEERKHSFLRVHVLEYCYIPEEDEDDTEENEPSGTIFDLLDKSTAGWDENLVNEMYALSERCLEPNHRRRPKLADILKKIECLSN